MHAYSWHFLILLGKSPYKSCSWNGRTVFSRLFAADDMVGLKGVSQWKRRFFTRRMWRIIPAESYINLLRMKLNPCSKRDPCQFTTCSAASTRPAHPYALVLPSTFYSLPALRGACITPSTPSTAAATSSPVKDPSSAPPHHGRGWTAASPAGARTGTAPPRGSNSLIW
jgi:hypothetical protein